MTNWIAANVVTWGFEISNFKNLVGEHESSYVYKTTFNGVQTPKLALTVLFPNFAGQRAASSSPSSIAVLDVHLMNMRRRWAMSSRPAAATATPRATRHQRQAQHRLSMAIAGGLAGAGAALYYLSGNTEFFWNTYTSLPATGFNGIPVALLAGQQPPTRGVHRHLHVHAGHRRHAAHQPHGL